MAGDKEHLEHLIDRFDLGTVLLLIAEICGEKAEHCAVNWQDSYSARAWAREGRRVAKLAHSCTL